MGESAHINIFPAYSLPSQLLTLKRILHQQHKKDFGQQILLSLNSPDLTLFSTSTRCCGNVKGHCPSSGWTHF